MKGDASGTSMVLLRKGCLSEFIAAVVVVAAIIIVVIAKLIVKRFGVVTIGDSAWEIDLLGCRVNFLLKLECFDFCSSRCLQVISVLRCMQRMMILLLRLS